MNNCNCKLLNGGRRTTTLPLAYWKENSVSTSEWQPDEMRNKEVDVWYFKTTKIITLRQRWCLLGSTENPVWKQEINWRKKILVKEEIWSQLQTLRPMWQLWSDMYWILCASVPRPANTYSASVCAFFFYSVFSGWAQTAQKFMNPHSVPDCLF